MNSLTKTSSIIALSAMLLLGAGCSANNAPAAETSPAAELLTPSKAIDTIESFVAATTTDEIAAAFPDKATKTTFATAVKLVDPEASTDKAAIAMADFAMVKVSSPKAKVTVEVDAAKVVVKGKSATVPVSAVVVKIDGKKAGNSDALADQINDLVFSEDEWLISFVEPTPSAKPSENASAKPSSSSSAKPSVKASPATGK